MYGQLVEQISQRYCEWAALRSDALYRALEGRLRIRIRYHVLNACSASADGFTTVRPHRGLGYFK
jgi:hypothetical protein